MARREINWCAKGTDDPYVCYDLDEPVTFFDPSMDFGLLMVHGGVFPSVSRAWKEGYKGPIPFGWTDFRCHGVDVYIYNPDNAWLERQVLVCSGYDDYVTKPDGTFDVLPGNPEMYGPFMRVSNGKLLAPGQ